MVAQAPLHDPDRVAAFLAEPDENVVDVPLRGLFRDGLAPLQPHAALVTDRLGGERRARAQRHRVDQRQPGKAGHQAEHQHAPVGAAQPGEQLLPDLEPLDPRLVEVGDRLHPRTVERQLGWRLVVLRAETHGHRLRDPFGALGHPRVVRLDGFGERSLQPVREIVPYLDRVTLVEGPVDDLHDLPGAFPQVVLGIGEQIGDLVGKQVLPTGAAPPQLVALALGALQQHGLPDSGVLTDLLRAIAQPLDKLRRRGADTDRGEQRP